MTNNFIGNCGSGRLQAMFEGLESRICFSAFDGMPVLVDAAPVLRADQSPMSRYMLRLMRARGATPEPAAAHVTIKRSAADASLRNAISRIDPRLGTSSDPEAGRFIENLLRLAPTDAAREWLASAMRSDDARAAIRAAMVHDNTAGVSPKEKFATLFVNQFEQLLKIWPGPSQQTMPEAPSENSAPRPPIERNPASAPVTTDTDTTRPPPNAITPPVNAEPRQPEAIDEVAGMVPTPDDSSAPRVDYLIQVLEETAATYGGSAATAVQESLSRYLLPVANLTSGYSISSVCEHAAAVVEVAPIMIRILPAEAVCEAMGEPAVAPAVMPQRTFTFAYFGAPFTLLADSIGAFVEDSASIAAAALAQTRVTTQPWLLTFAVIAADVVVLTYAHRRRVRFRGSYAAMDRGDI